MRLTRQQVLERLDASKKAYQDNYLAMYSSLVDGIITDPALMAIPLDDHLVHRGDGVFEMFKCVDGGIYNLGAHLDRLMASARKIGIVLPRPVNEIRALVIETIQVAGVRDGAIRTFVSRGPGSFGVNPYDCPVSQLYVMVSRPVPSFMTLHPHGAVVISSAVALKPPFFASMKNCNYLPNVLMKKEAIDAGADFSVGFDADGNLAEGATENVGIVTAAGALLCPELDQVLTGTTMQRVLALAQDLVKDGTLTQVGYAPISRDALQQAREMLIFGTTTDVTRVSRFDGYVLPADDAVFKALSQCLLADIHHGTAHRTPID